MRKILLDEHSISFNEKENTVSFKGHERNRVEPVEFRFYCLDITDKEERMLRFPKEYKLIFIIKENGDRWRLIEEEPGIFNPNK